MTYLAVNCEGYDNRLAFGKPGLVHLRAGLDGMTVNLKWDRVTLATSTTQMSEFFYA